MDYPSFLLCRWDQSIGKENQLRVYGPTLTETITERILGEHGAFVHDWKARVNSPLSQRVHVNRGGTLPRKPPSVLANDAASDKFEIRLNPLNEKLDKRRAVYKKLQGAHKKFIDVRLTGRKDPSGGQGSLFPSGSG